MSPILKTILETKRPTNNPIHNTDFTLQLLSDLDIASETDTHHNIWVNVGESKTAFTAHTDTVDNKTGKNWLSYKITKEGLMVSAYNSVLGADDGAGMFILIRMIQEKIPGHYIFFSTEEMGRIGSSRYKMPGHVQHCISFDRKGTNNLITHQVGESGCSDEFANTFIQNFNLPFVKDPTGSFTDSYSFFDEVPECTNLSVGYYDQHSKNEVLNYTFLEQMVDACIAMEWTSLPAVRDPTVQKFNASQYGRGGYWSQQKDDLEELCYQYPEVAASLLEDYGVTERDFQNEALRQYYQQSTIEDLDDEVTQHYDVSDKDLH